MRRWLQKCALSPVILGAVLGFVASPAAAQQEQIATPGNANPTSASAGTPANCPLPGVTQRTSPYCPPTPCPGPYSYSPSGTPPSPGSTPPSPGSTPDQTAAPDAGTPSFASPSFGAGVGSNVAFAAPGGYLDSAIPMTQFRLRYDAGYGMNRPDRDEYFYGAWSDLGLHPHAIVSNGVAVGYFFDKNAKGPQQSGDFVSYQEASAYVEYAVSNRFSGFVELPYRGVRFQGPFEDNDESGPNGNPDDFNPAHPEQGENANPNNNPNGISDLQIGFKYAFIADPDQYLTFQFRYLPTGDASQGLGTGHVSIEPSLLYYKQLTSRLIFQGQLTDWIPIDGTAEAGNLISYGLGLAYDVYRSDHLKFTPVVEFMGWTALSGYESFAFTVPGQTFALANFTNLEDTHGVKSAVGDTIVDAKMGLRTYFGESVDFYVGYGRSLTGDRWYTDLVRAEFRIKF